jgi:hypothetical protein
MSSAVAIDPENAPDQEPDDSGVALWDALITGTARERLIERLAQAHLIQDPELPREP